MLKCKKILAGLTAGATLVSGVVFSGNGGGITTNPLAETAGIVASADDTTYTYGDYLTYVYLDDGTIEISECGTGIEGELEIPSEIDGVAVTAIGEGAFQNCFLLTSVTIPDSVTSIGDYAFDYCMGLTSVTIGDGVTSIGGAAFTSCVALTSVTIGNSVTSIGDSAFWCCTSLTSVTIPDSVTSIEDSAFYFCTSLISVTIPDSVTSIGSSAFRECSSLTSITILNPDCEISDDSDDGITISNGYDFGYYYTGIIYGYTNSTAQTYAGTYGYTFIALDEEISTTYGDLTGDNKVNLSDLILLSKAVAGLVTLSSTARQCADLNCDSDVDAADTLILLKFQTNLISTLPYIE